MMFEDLDGVGEDEESRLEEILIQSAGYEPCYVNELIDDLSPLLFELCLLASDS